MSPNASDGRAIGLTPNVVHPACEDDLVVRGDLEDRSFGLDQLDGIVSVEVLRLGKMVGFVEGRLMDSEGRMLARATSSVMLIPAELVS